MRFLVLSDLHLDHPFADVGPEHAERRRANLRACLDRVLALADAHDVDAILSAGDLYEHRHVQPDTAQFLADRFGEAGRPVFLAPGDEDPHTPDSVYATTAWPSNVHVFDHDLLVPVELAPGFRLWGAAHLRGGGTVGFLDGFRITDHTDDTVDLALFHGSEMTPGCDDRAPVMAPFRADQVGRAGLAHAFVGHGRTAVDGPWHTNPGNPDPLCFGDPHPRGAVIVDVTPDGTLHRERHDVAVSRLHEVVVDLTGAANLDEVLERVLDPLEDLEGTVRVTLDGQAAPGVVVEDDEITDWSTDHLAIVLAPRPAAPVVDLDVEPIDLRPRLAPEPTWHPSQEAAPEPTPEPAPEPAPAPAVAAVGAVATLERVEPAAPATPAAPAAPAESAEPTTQPPPVTPEPVRPTVVARPAEAPAAAPRSPGRTMALRAAALLTVCASVGLLVIADTLGERVVPAVAIAIVIGLLVVTRRPPADEPELEAIRAQVQATLRCIDPAPAPGSQVDVEP